MFVSFPRIAARSRAFVDRSAGSPAHTVHLRWLCAGLLAASLLDPGVLHAERPQFVTRITNAYPAWSPDGAEIAYMSDADGDFDIYVIHLENGEIRQLTDAPDRDGTPVFSPGGESIAFQSFRDGNSEVYVMDRDGTNVRNLSRNPAHDEHPIYSRDSARILFSSDRDDAEGGTFDLYEMSADGSETRRITETRETETYASWSPDGEWIVCRKVGADDDWEVVVMRADGSEPRSITRDPARDGWPSWSPDGTHILFTSKREEGYPNLFLTDLEGSPPIPLTASRGTSDRQAAWSPDGTRIAFARYWWFFDDEPRTAASQIMIVAAPALPAHVPAG